MITYSPTEIIEALKNPLQKVKLIEYFYRYMQNKRLNSNWTRCDLAEKLNVDEEMIRDFERGHLTPTPLMINKVFNLFGDLGEKELLIKKLGEVDVDIITKTMEDVKFLIHQKDSEE